MDLNIHPVQHPMHLQIFQKLYIQLKKCKCKSCLKLNFLQKVRGRICLSPRGVELGAPKIGVFEIL